ncbi:MAG TPA: ATP-binding protein [Roseiarcus sp.]|nr:ATP-binding protein [Roseiarcus sp.]
MDLGAGLADYAVHALWLQAGAAIALALALVAGVARARRQTEARATRIAAENEGLRDELWRLKEAASARDRAEAASEAKSRFLTTMSHEVRTPISGILGMADLLREASLDPENASYVEAIRSSGSALIALIDEILDLAKIEAGRFDLVVETVDLRRLTEGVIELLAPPAQSKGIEIACSFSADAPRFVRADGLRLRQVLTNLAGNAVKFTDQGGVCVTVERGDKGAAQFSVIDTGPGVPADRRAAIFDSFEQGDGSHARRFEGAGLGLTISSELVRLMGGELTLADNPDGGSIFAFAVQLPECAAVEPLAARETRRSAPDGTRALIIADSPFEAPAMGARLKEAGVSVERALGLDSGLEALSGAQKPDIVIVDCALGPEATNRLAQAAREAGVKRSLVLFSPFERRAFGQAALKGFDGWLVKPVRARSLFERVAWDTPPVARSASRLSPASVRRALVAEDNDINALITQKALRRLGFEVVRAVDGEEALRLASPIAPLESRPFDVILMDLKMPGLDGYEATRRLRRLEAACGWSSTPIVALTANAFDERGGSSTAAGFDAFLVKPVEFGALAGTIERVCAARATPWRERLRAS